MNTHKYNKTNRRNNYNNSNAHAAYRKRTNNKPVVVLFLTFVISFLFILGMQFVDVNANKAASTTMRRQYINIEIEPGDTLSSIASEYMSAGYSNLNDYIDDIKKVNSMKESTIYSGQSLIIPTYVAMEE